MAAAEGEVGGLGERKAGGGPRTAPGEEEKYSGGATPATALATPRERLGNEPEFLSLLINRIFRNGDPGIHVGPVFSFVFRGVGFSKAHKEVQEKFDGRKAAVVDSV